MSLIGHFQIRLCSEIIQEWETDIAVFQRTESIRPCISELSQCILTGETKRQLKMLDRRKDPVLEAGVGYLV